MISKIWVTVLLALAGRALAESQSDAFYAAIRSNDLARLEGILNQAGSANSKDERGLTPLMYAATAGSADAMKLLIDKGADVNARNAFGSTAMMWSVTDLKKVRLLVDHGADVNIASKAGHTALLLAAMSDNSAEIVRLLIAKGADLKAVDSLKKTALIAASEGNDTGTIEMLIDAGLGVNAADILGFTPLMNAAGNNNLTAVKMLLAKGANVNAISLAGGNTVKAGTIALGKFTPLLLASVYGPVDLVKTLLAAGADVNAKDVRGMTPLMLAVATDRQNGEIIRALLDKGADVNVKSEAGETALDWARKMGETPALRMLAPGTIAPTPVHGKPGIAANSATALKAAVEKSIALLEKSSAQFFVNGGCVSCHHQDVTDFAVSFARPKGATVDEKAAAERKMLVKGFFTGAGPSLLERLDGPGSPDVPLYTLAAMHSTGYVPDRTSDAMLANVVAMQWSDGRWHGGAIARPPLEDGDIFRTALGIRAMMAFGSPGRAAEMKARIEKSNAWLAAAKAETTEDRNMQLLGLHWGGTDRDTLQRLAKSILANQAPDGGWAQRAGLECDAYATGQTLVALAEGAGVSPKDAAYQKAVNFLLSTQRPDGSWFVRSRSPKFQPYLESGFPYGHDQWISSMATGWAATALTIAMGDEQKTKTKTAE